MVVRAVHTAVRCDKDGLGWSWWRAYACCVYVCVLGEGWVCEGVRAGPFVVGVVRGGCGVGLMRGAGMLGGRLVLGAIVL